MVIYICKVCKENKWEAEMCIGDKPVEKDSWTCDSCQLKQLRKNISDVATSILAAIKDYDERALNLHAYGLCSRIIELTNKIQASAAKNSFS
jgi:hypothetical protein